MASLFDLWRGVRRVAAGYRRNRFATLQIIGGVMAISIAAAANPTIRQAPASSPETGGTTVLPANPEDGAYGSTQPPSDNGLRLEQFAQTGLFRILGKEVRSASGQNMGIVVDVLFDRTGRPRAAIIDFGGFLGVGTRRIAIDWRTLRFEATGEKESIVAALDRDQIKAAPEYKGSHQIVAIVTPARPEASDSGW
jgi:PRC-barrel domain